jgi:Mycothiol maleylpyruvate isomerase N-terminal domain
MRRMPANALTTADHIELLGAEADRFASSLAAADLGATVVTCPDWTVRDLVSHVGGLHRWSTELVASGIVAETWRASLPLDYPDGAAPLEAWRDSVHRHRGRCVLAGATGAGRLVVGPRVE